MIKTNKLMLLNSEYITNNAKILNIIGKEVRDDTVIEMTNVMESLIESVEITEHEAYKTSLLVSIEHLTSKLESMITEKVCLTSDDIDKAIDELKSAE